MPPKKIEYNELFTELGVYTSTNNLPDEVLVKTRIDNRLLWALGISFLVLFPYLLYFLNGNQEPNTLIFILGIINLSLIGTVLYSLYFKVDIIINYEFIQKGDLKIKWDEAEQPEEFNFSGPLAMQIYQVIIKNKYEDVKIEFQCNNLNYSESAIKQLVYLYWKEKNN